MRSVADQLKAEDVARMAALTPEERVALSLRLGESALEVLCAAQGLTRTEALAMVQRIRPGRRPSRCAGNRDTLRAEVEARIADLPAESVALWRGIAATD